MVSQPLAPCGTRSAYGRHLRRGETPCADCRAANAADQRTEAYAIWNRRVQNRRRSIINATYRAEVSEETVRQKPLGAPGEHPTAARARAIGIVGARHPDAWVAALAQARQEVTS